MANSTKSPSMRALQVLKQHELDVESLRLRLSQAPNEPLKLMDAENAEEWAFILRRRCRLFIMAKNKYMKYYEEIAVSSK